MLKVNNKDIRTTSLTIIYSRDNLYNKKKKLSVIDGKNTEGYSEPCQTSRIELFLGK